MAARRWPFLYMSSDRKEAVASSSGGHSSVTDVWVTLRRLISGAFGVPCPNSSKISRCRSQNSQSLLCSSATFCVTEMFTMEPVVAPGGRSNEGNSMRWARSPRRIAMPASNFPTVNIKLSGDESDIFKDKVRTETESKWPSFRWCAVRGNQVPTFSDSPFQEFYHWNASRFPLAHQPNPAATVSPSSASRSIMSCCLYSAASSSPRIMRVSNPTICCAYARSTRSRSPRNSGAPSSACRRGDLSTMGAGAPTRPWVGHGGSSAHAWPSTYAATRRPSSLRTGETGRIKREASWQVSFVLHLVSEHERCLFQQRNIHVVVHL